MTESIVCRTERANPAQSIQPSVRSTITKSTRTNSSEIKPINRTDFKMRDLYNRKQKLEHWIEKAKTTLDEPDRTHILKNNVESISQYHHISYNYINWLIK